MKTTSRFLTLLAVLALAAASSAHAEIAPGELVAPKVKISGGNVNFTVHPSVIGRSYKLEYTGSMESDTWQDPGVVRIGDGNDLVISIPYEPGMPRRFYRLVLDGAPAAPPTSPGAWATMPRVGKEEVGGRHGSCGVQHFSGELSCGRAARLIDGDCLTTLSGGGGRSLIFRVRFVLEHERVRELVQTERVRDQYCSAKI
jgi:hypothetical protein